MQGSQYNRAWLIHSIVSEGMERLLLKRFLFETRPEIPTILTDAVAGDTFTTEVIQSCSNLNNKYEHFKSEVRNGSHGKTPQFWIMYLDLMRIQHMAHTAVQENNFDLRAEAWKKLLPLYFAFNMFNYARYGSFYVETLNCINDLYPGMRPLLTKTGLSIQGQDRYPLRTAIDQRGEQTINRDAKTSGGIKSFSTNQSSVLKWCLNRAEAANNTHALNNLAGLGEGTSIYKPLRPSQILRSEELVSKVQAVLETEYINPFGYDIVESQLLNLSSGMPVPDDAADIILKSLETGKTLSEDFKRERLYSQHIKFHNPIKRNNYASFSKNKITVTKDNKAKTIEVNRNIIGNLLSFTVKTGRVIDFEKALQYPLSSIPLSISHPDGSRRETAKSKLKGIIVGYNMNEEKPENEVGSKDVLIVDMIAQIQTMQSIPCTYEGFAENFIKSLPTGYNRVDLIADTYKDFSIKAMERKKRGESKKVLIKSLQSKIPHDFSRLLKNGENKTRLIELLSSYIEQHKNKVFNSLRCYKIVISLDCKCLVITRLSTTEDALLSSNQEEADTKLILHSHHILSESPETLVTLRSSSGDTDVIVLAIALLHRFRERVVIDDGSGKNRRLIKLKDLDIQEEILDALIGFHAYTGNDYVSSFFRKGKGTCFQVLDRSNKFKRSFAKLGDDWQLSDQLFTELEEFTCYLYGARSKDINKLRYKIFDKKYTKENKIIDMCTLPPCRSVLKLHAERANFVAALWKRSTQSNIGTPSITSSGWSNDGTITWIDSAFPSEIEDILLDDEYDESDCEYGDEGESDTEC